MKHWRFVGIRRRYAVFSRNWFAAWLAVLRYERGKTRPADHVVDLAERRSIG